MSRVGDELTQRLRLTHKALTTKKIAKKYFDQLSGAEAPKSWSKENNQLVKGIT